MPKTSTKKLIAGVDGDVVIYRAAFKAQYPQYQLIETSTGDVLKTAKLKKHIQEWQELAPMNTEITHSMIHLDSKIAIHAVKRALADIKKHTKATELKVYISGDTNFRTDIAGTKPYKGNRKELNRPSAFDDVRDFIINNYPHEISDYCEADDLLSINLTKAYSNTKNGEKPERCNFIVCTIDKDLRTVPGYHYHLDSKQIDWVNAYDAATLFYKQMLTGDVVDNIGGLYGVGKAGANKLLNPVKEHTYVSYDAYVEELEKRVFQKYAKEVSNPAAYFLEQGRLLHMQRFKDELWIPKIYNERPSKTL